MMKKLGFTLAEVLITLGIIGVVAALTAPALVMSGRNQSNAAKLSVVVSNLENAFTNAIAQEGADNLYGTRMWAVECAENGVCVDATDNDETKARFVGELGRYLVVNGFKDSDTEYYQDVGGFHPMTATGATNSEISIASFGGTGQMFPILTKNGAAILIRTYNYQNTLNAQREAAIAVGCTYYTNAADIAIDVNGTEAPNTLGRDIFWFQLGENGIIYPVGGRDVARLEAGSGGGIWDAEIANRDSCTDASKGTNENLMGMGCTARVIEEGYQMNY